MDNVHRQGWSGGASQCRRWVWRWHGPLRCCCDIRWLRPFRCQVCTTEGPLEVGRRFPVSEHQGTRGSARAGPGMLGTTSRPK